MNIADCLWFQQSFIAALGKAPYRTETVGCQTCARMIIALRRLSAYVHGQDVRYA